jgi:hypothetical protein
LLIVEVPFTARVSSGPFFFRFVAQPESLKGASGHYSPHAHGRQSDPDPDNVGIPSVAPAAYHAFEPPYA